jgi:tetratricopeptide (TPR) repeat protein
LHRSASHDNLSRIGATARKAAHAGNWATVRSCADEILKQDKRHPEGWFLTGLLERDAGRNGQALGAFSKSLQLDSKKYEAAIELANQCLEFLRHREALALLQGYLPALANSAYYLDMAAGIYTQLGLHEKAWPLYKKANDLQPAIDHFEANLADCTAKLGRAGQAADLYRDILARHPGHHHSHFELSRLERAQDASHLERMKEILGSGRLSHEQSVYHYCAIKNVLEDLQQWPQAFEYLKRAGETAVSVSGVGRKEGSDEIDLIEKTIEVCDPGWLADDAMKRTSKYRSNSPVFVVGYPGTPTGLAGRVLASHSKIEDAGRTPYLEFVIKRAGGIGIRHGMTPAVIAAAAQKDIGTITNAYLNAIDYKLHGRPMFVDSLPGNFLYLGFIAKAFPDAQIVHLRQNPMDACLAIYEHSLFRNPRQLENIAEPYAAYERLSGHWTELLGDRVIEVDYESMVTEHEGQVRALLDRLDLDMEQACLDIQINEVPKTPADRQSCTGSLNRWKNWESQLQSLKEELEY